MTPAPTNSLYFWLPCNQPNFAHHADKGLLERMSAGRLEFTDLRSEGGDSASTTSVVRRALGTLSERTADGFARYHEETMTKVACVEIEFCDPVLNTRVTLHLSAAGLNCLSGVGASHTVLRTIMTTIIELPYPLDAAAMREHFVGDEYRGYLRRSCCSRG